MVVHRIVIAASDRPESRLQDEAMVRAAMRGLAERMHSLLSQLMTLDNFAYAKTAAVDALQPADAAVLAAANQDSSLEELHQVRGSKHACMHALCQCLGGCLESVAAHTGSALLTIMRNRQQ